jgi:hypothetical protein
MAEAPLRRVARHLTAARDPSPGTRRWLTVGGALAVAVAVVVSLRALDVDAAELTWWPLLLVALVLSPATIAANAAELKIMARATAPAPLSWRDALEAVVLATAANLLPLPGAALVRVQALRIRGAGTVAATVVQLAAAIAWLGVGLVLAGVALLAVPDTVLAGLPVGGGVLVLLVLVSGLVACGVSWATVARAALPDRTIGAWSALVAVEAGLTLLHGARLLLVLLALGVDLAYDQALVVAVSAPLSAATGIMPAGLGVAEAIAAVLAHLVALPAAAGVAATGLNRVLGLAMIAPLAAVVASRRRP